MQFRVPQNITMEDRIAGPFTAIQFALLVLGGMASFLIFTSGLPSPLNKIIGGLMGMLTLLLSVGKFNDQPMYRFFRFIIAFVASPKVRIWKKGGAEHVLIKAAPHKSNEPVHGHARKVSKSDLAGLAAVLDTRGQQGMVPVNPEEKK
ncbi:MAG TPA: PrgI family protein [Verrucomicrobiae bacterium]|nr:PrgI family protein [Verrucomicrobiae bacterium]